MKHRRNRDRLLAIVLSVAMLFGISLIANADYAKTSVNEPSVGELSFNEPSPVEPLPYNPSFEELIKAQAQAVKADDVLMRHFANGGALVYPDYFGGCYIKDNVLHIRLASPTEEELSEIKLLLSAYESVVAYEYCEFSRADAKKYADETVAALKAQGVEVCFWYVSSKTGDVIIGVLPDYVSSANAAVKTMQTQSSKRSLYPKVVIEEGGYTCTDVAPVAD